MIELNIFLELFTLVPEPTKEDLIALKKSIEEYGQYEPIIVWKDPVSDKVFIIDGHSRNEVCKKIEIEPKIEYKEFDSWDDAMLYAVHVNGKRRHLSESQKIQLAFREIEIEKKLADKRQKLTIPK